MPVVGVMTTRPCTWRNALESPTAAAGTASRTATVRLWCPASVIEVGETVAVWGAPGPCTTESAKLAGVLSRFSRTMCPLPLKSPVSSATPKLTLGVPSAAWAMTEVCVAPKGCTSPLPPRRAE